MVMTCNDVGIPFSGALSKVGKKKFKFTPTLFAPTSFSIPIPTGAPVMVGGPYAPDWGGMLTGLLSSIGFSTLLDKSPGYSNRVFKGYAHKGKSTMGWYYGFKLHLLCNERGELLNFALTKANVDDRNPKVFNNLTKDLFGKFYADKGYSSQSLFASLFDRGVHIVTGIINIFAVK
ncbi:hypothetical protein JCM15640A_22270 [Hoylesella timonensis 4401737 = DSM 22865 = JCM 15640]